MLSDTHNGYIEMEVAMRRLSIQDRAKIIACLSEGNSIRATSRLTGFAKDTVIKLLVDAGEACRVYQDRVLRDLPCKRVQVDEAWGFVARKQRNVAPEERGKGVGDAWIWTGLCADSKLLISWQVGNRDAIAATQFIGDLAGRLAERIQLSSDGANVYLEPIEAAFGNDVDYARLVKLYGPAPEGQHRYSPAGLAGIRIETVTGNPDLAHISTSFIERSNLTLRMHQRRLTRLTNGFSKKIENLAASISLYAMWYNFHRQHSTLRISPAMAAGVADHLWSYEEIAELVVVAEDAQPRKRGSYKKRKAG